MKRTTESDGILLENISCFSPGLTFDCGQAFRFTYDGVWRGIAFGKLLKLEEKNGTYFLYKCSLQEFEMVWRPYLDLDRDYDRILRTLSEDPLLAACIQEHNGIRILRQEPWETICSFIISQNNHIPRIKGIIERFCQCFGEEIAPGQFAFPPPERIAACTLDALAPLRAGFRAKYLLDAAQKVAGGELDFNLILNAPLEEAELELRKIKGIGKKVAQCILLYGFGRLDAFPEDVWMKRAMGLYPDGLPACTKGYEGIAQQYLFHHIRCHPELCAV